MVDQAKMNGNGNGRVHEPRMREHAAGFAHDLAALAELQMKLFAVDLRDGKQHAAKGAPWLIGAVVVGLSAVPVLLLGAASALVDLGLPQSAAQLIVAVVALAAAGGAAALGVKHLRQASTTFQRSRRELNETVSWVKDSLKPLNARTHQPEPTQYSAN